MKAYDLLLLFPHKNWAWFWMWPTRTQFLPKYDPKEHFLMVLPIFFQNYTIITEVITINSISWHISIEISKKNPWWEELKGKIWPNSIIQTKRYLPDLPHLGKIEWWISRIFTEPSNQITRFLQGFSTWNSDGFFFY